MSNESLATAKVMDTVNQHLSKVRKAGPNNIIALCPFHQDSSPSFSMNINNGLYICYACGEKGTFWSFLTKLGMTPSQIRYNYAKTLEELKRNAPPPPDPKRPDVLVEDNQHIPEDLVGLFHRCPEKLLDEGFTEATLLDFGVGLDTWHDRITYPIRDLKGKLAGISGRALDDNVEPKYRVYEEEYRTWDLPPYHTEKSHYVWNAHRVYPERMKAIKPKPLVIVEGFKGCMWLRQAGVEHVIALMTKTMSKTQQWVIERMGGPYIIMGDNDGPGIQGVITISKELIKKDRVKLVEYDVRQPTDVPLEDVLELVQSATDYDEIALS